VAGPYEHGNERCVSVKGTKFLDQNDYHVLKLVLKFVNIWQDFKPFIANKCTKYVGFEVFTAVVIIFWDMTPCTALFRAQHSGAVCHDSSILLGYTLPATLTALFRASHSCACFLLVQ
jgi:hypothetical protein